MGIEVNQDLNQSPEAAVDASKANEFINQIKLLADTPDGNAETQRQLNDALDEQFLNILSKVLICIKT